MSEFLKGNFRVKRAVAAPAAEKEPAGSLSEKVRERALANICGSMVYVDHSELTWDGDDEPSSDS